MVNKLLKAIMPAKGFEKVPGVQIGQEVHSIPRWSILQFGPQRSCGASV